MAQVANFMKGKRIYNPPLWLLIMDAASGDPLRAQEIEAGLTREWWERWLLYRKKQGEAAEEMERRYKK